MPLSPTTIAIISAIFTVASTAYQIQQARKARKAAKDAAEARKGFEMVIEGEALDPPIVYGRAKIGGIRVWHDTKSSHTGHSISSYNANMVFDLGPPANNTYDIVRRVWDIINNTWLNTSITIPASSGGLLGIDQSGTKNEFLYFQQVLCHGPIHGVYDFVIDESRFADDPDFAVNRSKGGSGLFGNTPDGEIKAAMRHEVHYDGGNPNGLISRNFARRDSAKFHGMAYANSVIRLDRDDPAFHGQVPMVQYFIEGRLVRSVIDNGSGANPRYTISSQRAYTTNPPLCLLDYLYEMADRTYDGKILFDMGLSLKMEDLDLESFYKAAQVAARTNLGGENPFNRPTFGSMWKPITGTRNILSRNIPLYECNLMVDTKKPIRDNIESILSTMGDARLVWSQGKYKLLLQYPESNQAIDLAGTITDDDLAMGSSIEIQWPTASDRYNHAVVKFHNEAENFKEDSVSWPPKKSSTFWKPVGGRRYPLGNHEGDLTKNYGVWSGQSFNVTLLWKLRVPVNGTYTVRHQVDDRGTIYIRPVGGSNIYTSSTNNATHISSGTIALNNTTTYEIQIDAVESNRGAYAAAATLAIGNFTYWSTREPAFEDFIEVTRSSEVYDLMKAEDGGIELETNIFAEGVTDYYHALAKAEEIVRTSRSAANFSFSYIVKDRYYEPGDIIRLFSQDLSLIGDTFIRVNEAKLNENGICDLKGTRFDYRQLAWNVADTEYASIPNMYDFNIPAPYGLTFNANADIYNSVGTLTWNYIPFDSLAGFIVYFHNWGNLDSQGKPLFNEVGRSIQPTFTLPALKYDSAIFGVVAYSKSGRKSLMATTGTDSVFLLPGDILQVEIIASAESFVEDEFSRVSPPFIRLDALTRGFHNPVYKWYVDRELQTTVPEPTSGVGYDLEWREVGGTAMLLQGLETYHYDLPVVAGTEYEWRVSVAGTGAWTEWMPVVRNVDTTRSYFILPAFNNVHLKTVHVVVEEGGTTKFATNSREIYLFRDEDKPYQEVPPTPSGLKVDGGLRSMFLTWDDPLYLYHNHSRTKIYRIPVGIEENATPFGRADAVFLGFAEHNIFVDTKNIESRKKYCYWISFVSKEGVEGPIDTVAGTCGLSALDPEFEFELLERSINEDKLTQDLLNRIDLIDGSDLLFGSVNARLESTKSLLEGQIVDVRNEVNELLLEISDAPPFNQDTNYSIGDYVSYNSLIYRALLNMTAPSPLPTNTTYWKEIGDLVSLSQTVEAHALAIADHQAWITQNGGVVTSNANRVSALETNVNNPNTGLTSRALFTDLATLQSNIYGSSVSAFTHIAAEFNAIDANIINNYARKTELTTLQTNIYGSSVNSFSQIASRFQQVDADIAAATGVDLSSYATISYVDTTETDILGAAASSFTGLSTEFQRLDGRIDGINLTSYATKDELTTARSDILGSEVVSFTNISAKFQQVDADIAAVSGVDLSNYATIIYADTTAANAAGAVASRVSVVETGLASGQSFVSYNGAPLPRNDTIYSVNFVANWTASSGFRYFLLMTVPSLTSGQGLTFSGTLRYGHQPVRQEASMDFNIGIQRGASVGVYVYSIYNYRGKDLTQNLRVFRDGDTIRIYAYVAQNMGAFISGDLGSSRGTNSSIKTHHTNTDALASTHVPPGTLVTATYSDDFVLNFQQNYNTQYAGVTNSLTTLTNADETRATEIRTLRATSMGGDNILPDGSFVFSRQEGSLLKYYDTSAGIIFLQTNGPKGVPAIEMQGSIGNIRSVYPREGITTDVIKIPVTPDSSLVEFSALIWFSANFPVDLNRFRFVAEIRNYANNTTVQTLSRYIQAGTTTDANNFHFTRGAWHRVKFTFVITAQDAYWCRPRLLLDALTTGQAGEVRVADWFVSKSQESILQMKNEVTPLSAQWSVKSTVGGLTGGIGLYNDGGTVRFAVNAQRFQMMSTDVGGNVIYPFVVDAGVTYINTAVIKDASISRAKIGEINANSITAGTISAWTINGSNINASTLHAPTIVTSWNQAHTRIDSYHGLVQFNSSGGATSIFWPDGSGWVASGGLQWNTAGALTVNALKVIGTAQIKDLAVDTLQLAGQAVTFTQVGSRQGETTDNFAFNVWLSGSGAVLIIAVLEVRKTTTTTSYGRPTITLSSGHGSYVSWAPEFSLDTSFSQPVTIVLRTWNVPPAGTWTVTLTNGAPRTRHNYVVVQEIKR
jgi:hypothetical protein